MDGQVASGAGDINIRGQGNMRHWVVWLGAVVVIASASRHSVQASTGLQQGLAWSGTPAVSEAGHALARRVLESGGHGGLPFAIVDKRAALIVVYRGNGSLAGVSSALLGLTPGDHSAPGVGERAQQARLRISDRTTPAGRFESEPGHDLNGEALVWIDYDNALAIHRLRPAPLRERRPQRLASAHARDKRISAGCVVVPGAFYSNVVEPILGRSRGIVYVMPEDSAWQTLW